MRLPTISEIRYCERDHPVAATAAALVSRRLHAPTPAAHTEPGEGLNIGTASGAWDLRPSASTDPSRPWMWLRLDENGSGEMSASEPALLYTLANLLPDRLPDANHPGANRIEKGILLQGSFTWNRPLFDYAYAQTARSLRRFDPEAYVRALASAGLTHVEVNSLATHVPIEPGVAGEYYAQFYSYCPALTQFVDSTLTRGLYPSEYLRANLNRLKRLAALGRKYGLRPGLLCFEPRTLPSDFFDRYPTLRGARVDHPFRSHVPRYTLAQDHPLTRDHYRQMIRNLMREVPDLAYLSVWSNDSGSGFEYTSSLYVGRNGGPYMIREWNSHEKIAEAAGRSVVRWLRLLQEAAAETNPDFEVSLRLEPFKVEHDHIVAGLGSGTTAEVPSLLVRGYDLPYHHPRYPEEESAAGTIHHTSLEDGEREMLFAWRERGIEPHLIYAPSAGYNLEPLLGTPFPRMLHQKLKAMRDIGVRRIAGIGGLMNVSRTPYWPNLEVIRAMQTTPESSLDDILTGAAKRWAGDQFAKRLVDLWYQVDEAVSYLPLIPLYGNFGFVWLRTWIRPYVPDIEAIPAEDRLYYERFLVSTPNNPSINDLGRDVLFELITEQSGRRMAGEFDQHVLPRLDRTLAHLDELCTSPPATPRAVFVDLRDRVRALRCWSVTQRNTCAWVAGVHGYLRSTDDDEKATLREYLNDMIDRDLTNTEALLHLWEESDTEFMLISEVGETAYIYGENFGDHLRTKIQLTEAYRDREPRIDRDIIWRV